MCFFVFGCCFVCIIYISWCQFFFCSLFFNFILTKSVLLRDKTFCSFFFGSNNNKKILCPYNYFCIITPTIKNPVTTRLDKFSPHEPNNNNKNTTPVEITIPMLSDTKINHIYLWFKHSHVNNTKKRVLIFKKKIFIPKTTTWVCLKKKKRLNFVLCPMQKIISIIFENIFFSLIFQDFAVKKKKKHIWHCKTKSSLYSF